MLYYLFFYLFLCVFLNIFFVTHFLDPWCVTALKASSHLLFLMLIVFECANVACLYVSVREYKQNCPFASFLLDLRNFQNNKQKKNHHFFNFTIFSIGPQSPVRSWSYFVSLQFSTLWLCVGHIYLMCRSIQQHQENLCLKKTAMKLTPHLRHSSYILSLWESLD